MDRRLPAAIAVLEYCLIGHTFRVYHDYAAKPEQALPFSSNHGVIEKRNCVPNAKASPQTAEQAS